jgi:hypothetical protein
MCICHKILGTHCDKGNWYLIVTNLIINSEDICWVDLGMYKWWKFFFHSFSEKGWNCFVFPVPCYLDKS